MGKTGQFLSPGKKTQLLCLILMATASFSWAGIPLGYYDSATGKSGSELKSALHAIVSNHTKKTYDQAWEIIKETDRDPNNSNNIILLYTGRSQEKDYRDHGYDWDYTQYDGGSGDYNESWNREHVWAKSHGFPLESDTAYTDLHHLRPADRTVNSSRNNKDFDDGGTLHPETDDCYTDADSWEPRDEVKGDVARMLFYMTVRYDPGYHSDNSQYDLELIDSTGVDIGDAPGRPVIGKLSTLLAWHATDPVDAFEQNRNDVVYSYQGNRNPFIDHPEYVDNLWNDELPAPTNLSANSILETSLNLSWADNAVDETGYYVYRNDSKIATLGANSTSNPVTGLTRGTTYNFKVSAYRSATESTKTSLDVTTNGSGNLIITGIYDGPLSGGLPKGIELYTINNIADLSTYKLGLAANGGAISTTYTFPSVSKSTGDYIYVATEAIEFANWFGMAPTYTSGVANINGDDVIELFLNNTVIDVYGVLGEDGTGMVWEYMDGWAYSMDNRSANPTFNSSQWTYSGPNVWDNDASNTNATSSPPFPVGTFNYTDGSLPVVLSFWTATSSQGTVKLAWTTDSEIENQGFILERRQQGQTASDRPWTEISSFITNPDLLGQGSTSSRTDYTYIDKQVKVGETYTYRLADVDYRGGVTQHSEISVTVREAGHDLKPSDITLHAAFPNPFNPEVNLSFTLEHGVGDLSLEIYDIQGILINTLSSGYHKMGTHEYMWNGNDGHGNAASSGIYMVRLSTGSVVQIQRVTLLR